VTEAPLGTKEAELARARQLLAAAKHLYAGTFYEDTVSRAYYAVFHAACALLASIGRSSRTHEGVRTLINEHFVRPGLLSPEHARVLRQTAADRNDADYDTSATFDAQDSAKDIAAASTFVEAAEKIIATA
jgi:uncharacterized protein (UPF0332 family)